MIRTIYKFVSDFFYHLSGEAAKNQKFWDAIYAPKSPEYLEAQRQIEDYWVKYWGERGYVYPAQA